MEGKVVVTGGDTLYEQLKFIVAVMKKRCFLPDIIDEISAVRVSSEI